DADLLGNDRGRSILIGLEIGEHVERCPGVQNMAAPAPEDEINDMAHGSRHGVSPVLCRPKLTRPEEFVAMEPWNSSTRETARLVWSVRYQPDLALLGHDS